MQESVYTSTHLSRHNAPVADKPNRLVRLTIFSFQIGWVEGNIFLRQRGAFVERGVLHEHGPDLQGLELRAVCRP